MQTCNPEVLAPMVRKLTRRSQLGPAEIEAVLKLPFRLASLHPSRYLVREGETSESCALLLSGFAYRSKSAVGGARQILSIHLRGDMVDPQGGLLGVADHSVQALTQVEVAMISRDALFAVADAHPAVGRALWRDTLVDGSIFREWILNLGQRDARQRISHLLCELTVRQEEAGLCAGPRYQWPMTQEQLGDATGLTSVHVNRTIQGLRRDGFIDTVGRSVSITDWPGLQRAGDFDRAYLHQAANAAA